MDGIKLHSAVQVPCIGLKIGVSFSKKTLVGIAFAFFAIFLCHHVHASSRAMLVYSVLFLFLSMFQMQCGPRLTKALNVLWLVVAPIVGFFSMQLLLGAADLNSLGLTKIFLNVACCGVLLCLVFICTANFRTAVILEISLLLTLATANYFVYLFRGSELSPTDFLSVGTALQVADQYVFQMDALFVYGILLGAVYCFCGYCIPVVPIKRTFRHFVIDLLVSAFLIAFITL